MNFLEDTKRKELETQYFAYKSRIQVQTKHDRHFLFQLLNDWYADQLRALSAQLLLEKHLTNE